MRHVPHLQAILIAAALAVPASLPASPRVTIRGTGNDISVEHAEAAPSLAEQAAPASVLDEAIRLKASGASDEAIVGFLRAHRDLLPTVVDFGTVSALREAGAGRSVVAYLSSVAAVEVGPTGAEGRSEEPEGYGRPPEYEMTNELPADLAWGGGWWGPGFVANGDFQRGNRLGRGRVPDRGFGKRPVHLPAASPAPRPSPRQAPAPQQAVRGMFPRR
ncbi:MAG TPA: hypothetical protein VFL12_12245 [Thermoanaerobaculia bacterium]|nr:hypothetical protein [Thermoanaerobaculia bacterium]